MARIGGKPRSLIEENVEKNKDIYVQALARGLAILSLFDIEHPEWSLSDISRCANISKTAAYRMLRTLEIEGFVAYNPDAELYHIGHATIPVAYLALSNIGFSQMVHPILEKLADITGETVELAVEGNGGAVVVDHVATSHPFKPNLPLGRVLRNLSNSGMKVLIAYHSAEEQDRIVQEHQAKLTPNTSIDSALLSKELKKIAKNGVAFDIEEQDLGVCAVSAPVFSHDGRVQAAVTLVVPADRFGPENRKRYTEAVKAAAVELSGYIAKTPSI